MSVILNYGVPAVFHFNRQRVSQNLGEGLDIDWIGYVHTNIFPSHILRLLTTCLNVDHHCSKLTSNAAKLIIKKTVKGLLHERCSYYICQFCLESTGFLKV